MDLSNLGSELQRRFEAKVSARDKALTAGRRSIRLSANAIRAIHRGEFDEAHRLMDASLAEIAAGRELVEDDYPDVYFAALQDAQKEYVEARLTEALVTGADLVGPDELGVELAPYVNGLAEAVGEGRRSALDLLRTDDLERSERILAAMEDVYNLLVSMDFPDAVTGNLRRSTDIARSIMEKTRGDLSLSLVQRNLRVALERHAGRLDAEPGSSPG